MLAVHDGVTVQTPRKYVPFELTNQYRATRKGTSVCARALRYPVKDCGAFIRLNSYNTEIFVYKLRRPMVVLFNLKSS